MKYQVRSLQEAFLSQEREMNEGLGEVRAPLLATLLADGRTLRQALHELTDHYKEHTEQLIWSKRGGGILISEARRVLAQLQGARAEFAAYCSDLQDAQLDTASAPGDNASPRGIIIHALAEESRTADLIMRALKGSGS